MRGDTVIPLFTSRRIFYGNTRAIRDHLNTELDTRIGTDILTIVTHNSDNKDEFKPKLF